MLQSVWHRTLYQPRFGIFPVSNSSKHGSGLSTAPDALTRKHPRMSGGVAMDAAGLTTARPGERVMVSVESRLTRWIGTATLVGALGLLTLLVARDHRVADWYSTGRLTWSLSLLLAVILAARGILVGRPVTVSHATAAMVVFLAGAGAHLLSLELLGDGLVVGAAVVLVWPMPSRPDPAALPRIWALIEA